MFEYAALFVAAFTSATIVLWLYRAIVGAGKVVYQAMLPSSKTDTHHPTEHLEDERLALTVNETKTPWGWAEHSTPARAARTVSMVKDDPVPWGWPGNDREIRVHEPSFQLTSQVLTESTNPDQSAIEAGPEDNQKEKVGWPYREDMFDFAGKAYKVVRKDAPERTELSTTGTPWGW